MFEFNFLFFLDAILSLVPENVTAIAYEKMKVMRPNFVGQKLLVKRTIALMWLLVLLGSLPNLLSTRYIVAVPPYNVGKCKLEPILNSLRLTFWFELFRLIVYHIIPAVYILYGKLSIVPLCYRIDTSDRSGVVKFV